MSPKLTRQQLQQIIVQLDPFELVDFLYDWEYWAREDQLEPEGEWITWLILGGRGAGKTRTGAEWIRKNVCGSTPMAPGAYNRVALVGETAADVRDVMVEGESGIMATSHPDFKPLYIPSKRRLVWPNGAVAICFSAQDPEQLRGPQHDLAWCDELAKWRYADETWSNLQFGLRLGTNPRQLVTTTPRPVKLIREMVVDSTVHVTKVSTYANRYNLAKPFMERVIKKYEGTRLGRQELMAELLEDNPNALFKRSNIDQHRVTYADAEITRIVVAVDPPATGNENSDECGIIVIGITPREHYFVLGDFTVQGRSPEEWSKQAIKAYYVHEADCIVAEVNQGGDMVESVLRNVDSTVRIKKVRASRGKWIRAEPVAALYEQGRVHHVGSLPELEDQMCDFDATGLSQGESPDRLDALVWGVTELTHDEAVPRVRML